VGEGVGLVAATGTGEVVGSGAGLATSGAGDWPAGSVGDGVGLAGVGLVGSGVGEGVGSAAEGLATGGVGTGEGTGPVATGVTAAHKAQEHYVVWYADPAATSAWSHIEQTYCGACRSCQDSLPCCKHTAHVWRTATGSYKRYAH
jgi:hypothetical protein